MTEHGEGFSVSSSFGAVLLPDEADDVSHALSLADERLYAEKHARRAVVDRSTHAFLEALAERDPEAPYRLDEVAELAIAVGGKLALPQSGLDDLSRAAQLHDVGNIAVPDEILNKRGPLDESDWEFIRQHTVVGERILRASPASPRSSARPTRTGTAAATPTALRVTGSRSRRGSSGSARRSRR